MDLKEAIEKLGGSYDDLILRLMTEAMARKFLTKFIDEQSFAELKSKLEANEIEEAFKASHTLKGLCQNLALGNLSRSSSDCCEALRAGNLDNGKVLFAKVQSDYDEAIRVLKEALA